MKLASKKQIEWNVRVQKVLPLGRVAAVWDILNMLYGGEDKNGKKLISDVFSALDKYDDHTRRRLGQPK